MPISTEAIVNRQGVFWSRVDVTPLCWLWKGGRTPEGYGLFRWEGGQRGVHRLAYEWLVGPIPEGLVLDHLCRNPSCVNPGHLEPVTNRENLLRGTGFAARNVLKTHCPQGHLLAGENLYRWGNQRFCRTCRRAHERRWKEVRRGA